VIAFRRRTLGVAIAVSTSSVLVAVLGSSMTDSSTALHLASRATTQYSLNKASLNRTAALSGHDLQSLRHIISSAGSSLGRGGIRPCPLHRHRPRRDCMDERRPVLVR